MYNQEQYQKNMKMDRNTIAADDCRDAIWQAEEDQKAIELQEALKQIHADVWDTYERDMEIYALMSELQGSWVCMWDDQELTNELVHLYRNKRAIFARLYEGVYTTLHPDDLARYINC
jgi:hypothetical protein